MSDKENQPPPKLPYVYRKVPGRAPVRFTPGLAPRKTLGAWPRGIPPSTKKEIEKPPPKKSTSDDEIETIDAERERIAKWHQRAEELERRSILKRETEELARQMPQCRVCLERVEIPKKY